MDRRKSLIVFWINDFEKKTKFASHFPPFQKGNFQDFPQIEDFFLGSQNDLKLFAARGARSRKINEARVNYVSSIVIKAHPKRRKEMKIRKLLLTQNRFERNFWEKLKHLSNLFGNFILILKMQSSMSDRLTQKFLLLEFYGFSFY